MSIFLTGTILYRYERTFHDLSMFTPRSCVLHCIFEASRVPLLKKKRERKEYSRSTQRQDWTVLAVTVHPSPPQATRSTQRQDGDCSAVTVNHRPHPGLAHPCRHKINATSGPGPGGGFDGRPGPGWQRFSVNLSHAAFAPRREQKGCQKATIYAASEF